MQHAYLDFVGGQLLQRADDVLHRAVPVGLDHDRPFGSLALLDAAHHLLPRAAAGGGDLLLAPAALAVLGDLAGAALAPHHRELVTGPRRAIVATHHAQP